MPTEQEQHHIATVRAYLSAVDSFSPDAVAEYLADDVVQTTLPSALTPHVSRSDRAQILTETREAGFFLKSQHLEIERIIASGEEVAIEGVFSGVMKGEMGPLKEGDTLRAYVAAFFVLRDGKISAQRNHYIFELPTP